MDTYVGNTGHRILGQIGKFGRIEKHWNFGQIRKFKNMESCTHREFGHIRNIGHRNLGYIRNIGDKNHGHIENLHFEKFDTKENLDT